MSKETFRIGLIFTPRVICSVSVLNSNDPQAYEFIGQIQPSIDEFMDRVREATAYKQGKLDRFVSSERKQKTVPGGRN